MEWNVYKIPSRCRECRFYNENEEGDSYCSLLQFSYQLYWESEDEDIKEAEKPDECTVTEVLYK